MELKIFSQENHHKLSIVNCELSIIKDCSLKIAQIKKIKLLYSNKTTSLKKGMQFRKVK
jgi:hypothetical protein